jgi:predicted nucleic acid-binding protein
MYLIDTNIAIELRDANPTIFARMAALESRPRMSLLTLVELEGGVYSRPELAQPRRVALDALLRRLTVEAFDADVVAAYGRIVAACGFSRPRILDRLIAATAIVNDLTLITSNGGDFADIPGLKLEIWPAPAQ